MNEKKINQNVRKEKLAEREELEALIQQSGTVLENLAIEAKNLAVKSVPLVFDHIGIGKMSLREARDIVESNAKFYLPLDAIATEEYLQQKINADIVLMTDLLRQSKVAEYAIMKMIEQIDEGNMIPRQFEVLSGFQRSKLELTKTIAQYIVMMENNYKNIKEDHKNKRNESALDIHGEEVHENDNGDMVTKGTRSMIQNIRQTIEEVQNEQETRINNENNKV